MNAEMINAYTIVQMAHKPETNYIQILVDKLPKNYPMWVGFGALVGTMIACGGVSIPPDCKANATVEERLAMNAYIDNYLEQGFSIEIVQGGINATCKEINNRAQASN